ncbi:uncharacterized protein A1O9_09710 [Exophiala aquamarina CBS 119918]|uniref:Alcohol dehydrogenase n=1 Tax=Exophiala aquamarina CBS 119918 TaxID=1182545 RepID=A0A072PED4_9EURO|nr:uncharacterized protein A1O9_09710 [Exophiala aquamarina CBS 119918]KEF53915.1 hypothetical protein A1O9_09710 [Exophiala aquamarina CBS 119918]
MSHDFAINLHLGATFRTFLYSQLFITPAYPTHSFAGQTVIVTGSNVGLGLEAARHIYRLDAAKLILAVRTVSKGEAAKEDIIRTVKHRPDGAEAIEVWPLDLTSTESTLSFADKAKSLPRLDVVAENAGISIFKWKMTEGFEETIQVNVINTFLLALSLLPKLRETKQNFPDAIPRLEIVTSELHHITRGKELNAPDVYAKLNDKESYDALDRYNISKLLEVLFVRELASRLGSDEPVIITLVNPGLCRSEIIREAPTLLSVIFRGIVLFIGRTTEIGSRTLVHGACAGTESHGQYMADGKCQDVEAWIYTDIGKKAQVKVFEQTLKVLEARKPGIRKLIGL